jgi:hypothetical protein
VLEFSDSTGLDENKAGESKTGEEARDKALSWGGRSEGDSPLTPLLGRIQSRSSISVMKNFLLRFEEKAVQNRVADTGSRSASAKMVTGTQTLTEVRNEGADKDPHAEAVLAFPR